jgi:hypothetical protein
MSKSPRLSDYKPDFGLTRAATTHATFEDTEENDGVSKWHKGFSEQINDVLANKDRMFMQIGALAFALGGGVTSAIGLSCLWENNNELDDRANFWKILTSIQTGCLVVIVFIMHSYDLRIEKVRSWGEGGEGGKGGEGGEGRRGVGGVRRSAGVGASLLHLVSRDHGGTSFASLSAHSLSSPPPTLRRAATSPRSRACSLAAATTTRTGT